MKIYAGLHRGFSHKDYCEDFLMLIPVNEDLLVGMVADGCSSGKHSHFASALQCKLMRKIIYSSYIDDRLSLQEIAIQLLSEFIKELKSFHKQYLLPREELLSTLILLIYSAKRQQAYMTALGDGGVLINKDLYEIDQDNRPDYPIYSIDSKEDELMAYFTEQEYFIENPSQIGIATDGIFSFHYSQQIHEITESNFANFLMKDTSLKEHNNMIQRKINLINTQYKAQPYDDIAVIRLIFDESFDVRIW
ncbi:MAG: protein phosphatase 2C domain-containing protein [Thermoflexibacter sp.]|jgi:hypothetical protein|nr:protein phosphatase 2C domain-containing protein [Thermoflexibacter sp.]